MADNVQITEGAGVSVGADEIASVKYQRVKVIHGADGTNDGDVSRANGWPVAPAQAVTTADLVTKAYSFFTASFQTLTLSGIASATSVYIWNDTDANILFNWDNGANSDFIVPARAAREVSVQTGSTDLSGKYASAPTTGNVYVEVRKG